MTFEAGPVNPAPFSIGIHVVPSFDVIDVLPQSAADRLRKLRQHVADFHALTIPFADIHEASNAKLEAERQLKRLTDHQHHGGFNLKPDDPRVIVAEQHLAKLVADQRRLNDRNETRSAAWREAGYPLVNVETWLRDGRPHGTVLQDYDGPAPKLLKNETVIDAIERLRRRGRDLNADLNRIRSAPFPSAYVRGKIKREVEALAQAGTPVVSDVLEHDRSWFGRCSGCKGRSSMPKCHHFRSLKFLMCSVCLHSSTRSNCLPVWMRWCPRRPMMTPH